MEIQNCNKQIDFLKGVQIKNCSKSKYEGKRIMKECKVITYLSFSGSCEEAVNAYINAFGGKILFLSRWDERNCDDKRLHGKIMHMEFLLGETNMAAGDRFETEPINEAVKLMIHTETEEDALKSIEILKTGGKVLSELAPHPEPDDGGLGCCLTDKYGVTWIITCPNPKNRY